MKSKSNSKKIAKTEKNLIKKEKNFIKNDNSKELLIYDTNSLTNFRRLCISSNYIENMFKIAHDKNYSNFARCFEIVFKT